MRSPIVSSVVALSFGHMLASRGIVHLDIKLVVNVVHQCANFTITNDGPDSISSLVINP
jgi:hypothetical protein